MKNIAKQDWEREWNAKSIGFHTKISFPTIGAKIPDRGLFTF